MNLFEKMAGATVQGRGIKIEEDADFVVRVDAVKSQQSNQGFGLLWVVEFTILEGTADNPEGATRSWVQRPESRAQTDLGNIKAFVAACEGYQDGNAASLAPDAFAQAISDEQPYAGKILKLNTQVIETKAKFLFTVHTWAPAPAGYEAPASAPRPSIPEALTKEAWLDGAGIASPHPDQPEWEFHPDHPEWGCRPRSGDTPPF